MKFRVDGVTVEPDRSIDEIPELLIVDDQGISRIAHSVAPITRGAQSWKCTCRSYTCMTVATHRA